MGVDQDFTEAVKWFRMAAEEGHAESEQKIGLMYYCGNELPRDNSDFAHCFFANAVRASGPDFQFET